MSQMMEGIEVVAMPTGAETVAPGVTEGAMVQLVSASEVSMVKDVKMEVETAAGVATTAEGGPQMTPSAEIITQPPQNVFQDVPQGHPGLTFTLKCALIDPRLFEWSLKTVIPEILAKCVSARSMVHVSLALVDPEDPTKYTFHGKITGVSTVASNKTVLKAGSLYYLSGVHPSGLTVTTAPFTLYSKIPKKLDKELIEASCLPSKFFKMTEAGQYEYVPTRKWPHARVILARMPKSVSTRFHLSGRSMGAVGITQLDSGVLGMHMLGGVKRPLETSSRDEDDGMKLLAEVVALAEVAALTETNAEANAETNEEVKCPRVEEDTTSGEV